MRGDTCIATRTARNPATFGAIQGWRKPAAIDKQNALLLRLQALINLLNQIM